jgi:hypothetical protein
MKIFHGKKGVSLYLSWVLLIVLAVTLSVFVYKWVSGLAKETTSDLIRQYDGEDCSKVSLRIEKSCQDTQALYINITNNNDLGIDAVLVRLFDIYKQPSVVERNISVDPGRTEQVSVIKQHSVRQVEVIPVRHVDDFVIVCTKRVAKADVSVCT